MNEEIIKSLVPIFRAMVASALYYEEYPDVDDGRMCCHYCQYSDTYQGEWHGSDCPIPFIEAWLSEYDKGNAAG